MSVKFSAPIAVSALLALSAGGFFQPASAEEQMAAHMPMAHVQCPMMADKDHAAMHAMMMQHHMGASSMPFDLAHSLHIFTPMPDGGEQDVVSTNGDTNQIGLIRAHLQKEANLRARGDYGTPAHIHGASMPGLAEMASGTASIHVAYVQLPAGGRIVYTTTRPELVKAIHTWLDAQAHDHADDAMLSHQ